MRHLNLVLLLLCMAVSAAYAQNDTVHFYITIPDKNIIADVEHGGNTITPVFHDPDINAIIDNYEITQWKKEYPTSDYEELRWVYHVQCNSLQLAKDLQNYNATYFPQYVPLKMEYCYTPNDWDGWGSGQQMDYINAKTAWDYSKGDSNVVIGVTDTYFDLNHEDLLGQYAQVRANSYAGTSFWEHGTVVAGLIAARTDNGKGLPGIGFKCKLDVSSAGWHGPVLTMSQQGRKVFNGSWLTEIDSPHNEHHYAQPLYNEVYENGMIAIFAAGNARPKVERNNKTFAYPASLDHNISVTGVGWENDTSNVPGIFNAKDVHEITAGDSTQSHQHNSKIDICAPSVRVSSLYYKNTPPPEHYAWRSAWGTSFASPMVAGTCGLMLSANPWLSPYQMEYLLKTTAKNIYGNQFNAKYFGTNPYNGRLGAGALNAGNAAYATLDFQVDNPTTRTFIIEGIDINTICEPGIASNGVFPFLTVKVKNGTAPYTYKWEPVFGNEATLSSLTSASPAIVSATGNRLLYYRLTVYDNSPIQKVANRYIKIRLISDGTKYDLAMQDHFADMLDERNSMDTLNPRHWSIWESPDLINKYTSTIDPKMTHQNPNYDSTNYLHIKVKNVGCTNSPEAQLHLYWTMPSTGETWPDDWKGTSPPFINNMPVGGELTPATGLAINGLSPGQSVILTHHWQNPPRPQDYDTSGTLPTLETCILARIVEPNEPNLGMHNEQVNLNVKENVWENNNIVTRNLIVTNFNASLKTSKKLVLVATTGGDNGDYTIEMLTEKDINPHYAGNLSRYLTATLHLGNLFDLWDAGGRQGNAVAVDNEAKTVTYDFTKPLRLENIHLQASDRFPVYIEFNLKDNITVPYAVEDQLVYFRQLTHYQEEIDMGDGTTMLRTRDNAYGNITFAINIEADEEGAAGKSAGMADIATAQAAFSLYPNPVTEQLSILALGEHKTANDLVIVDITGRTIMTEKEIRFSNNVYTIDTKALQSGIYFVRLVDGEGQSHAMRFIKTK